MLRGLDPAIARTALSEMIEKLQARHIKVLLIGMRASPSLGRDYVTRFESIYPDLATRYGLPLYPFFLEGMVQDPKFTLPDGLHPNAQGVRIIVRNILPSVEALIDRASAPPAAAKAPAP